MKTAFFLCDLQTRFSSIIYKFPRVVGTAQKMIKASKILDIPLVVTEHYPKALGNTVSELDISSALVIENKTKFSMFVPSIADKLKQLQTTNVVLFGIESHVCVLQTSLDLIAAGYKVYVLADGISSQNQSEIGIAVQRLRAEGAIITTSESILFQILGDAAHPKFKEISGLIKETKNETKEILNDLIG